eukprot:evm.model.scf_611.4 EVM.evm.TU.scf_611.4   scf_611:63945-73681(+)
MLSIHRPVGDPPASCDETYKRQKSYAHMCTLGEYNPILHKWERLPTQEDQRMRDRAVHIKCGFVTESGHKKRVPCPQGTFDPIKCKWIQRPPNNAWLDKVNGTWLPSGRRIITQGETWGQHDPVLNHWLQLPAHPKYQNPERVALLESGILTKSKKRVPAADSQGVYDPVKNLWIVPPKDPAMYDGRSSPIRMSRGRLAGGGHPLGVQPWGNFLLGGPPDVRESGLGRLGRLPDELLLQVLGELEALDLCRLATVSKALYCFAMHEEIWRQLVLQDLDGRFKFWSCWRTTYLMLNNIGYKATGRPPLKVQGFYSDLLYQPWFCSQVEMDPEWLRTENVERCSGLCVNKFRKVYEIPNRPVILTDVVTLWPAFQKWDNKYLCSAFGDAPVVAGGYNMQLEDYLEYCQLQSDEMPLYLFDKEFASKAPILAKDYYVPKFFKEDLFSVLGEDGRPDYRWLIMGPARSGSSFHKDPNATSAWNAVIKGSKKWILFPPCTTPPGVHPSEDGADVATPLSLLEWFLNFYGEWQQQEVQPLECVVHAGELIFVPRGWWHMAINLEESIAVTQNYVSAVNLPHVLRFLGSKSSDLVSGCRMEDR